jgi:hypothetical protein
MLNVIANTRASASGLGTFATKSSLRLLTAVPSLKEQDHESKKDREGSFFYGVHETSFFDK